MSGWDSAADWWLQQIADDDVFHSDIVPLVQHICGERTGLWLDLGAGNGRLSAALPGEWLSCDLSVALLRHIEGERRPVACLLPDLAWLRPETLGGVAAVLVLEHIEDIAEVFRQVRRVVAPGGRLVVAMNHPAFTADGAGPVIDLEDGEVLWRWGAYFQPHSVEFEDHHSISFHHRPLSTVLNAAATTGWRLALVEERGLSPAAVERHLGYRGQEQIPRLLGVRWVRD